MTAAQKILQSWHANAKAWIATIECNDLESRVLVTNNAVVQAVLAPQPKKVLDIGCGEGWLCRALRTEGVEAWGIDAVPQLVEKAIDKDGPYYEVHTYETFARGHHQLPKDFDVVVFNFSLLDEQASANILKYVSQVLHPHGSIIIQTLHPSAVPQPEVTGWKEGNWAGMKQQFVLPYHWYYRTVPDWQQLFETARLKLLAMQEPQHPQSGKPLSTIFVLQATQS